MKHLYVALNFAIGQAHFGECLLKVMIWVLEKSVVSPSNSSFVIGC